MASICKFSDLLTSGNIKKTIRSTGLLSKASKSRPFDNIETIQDEAMKLYAHIYVRHMGDLSGGQMIKSKTPGPNRYYIFKHNEVRDYRQTVKETINTYLNVYEHSVVPEAIFCFESAAKLFKEMKELHDLGTID